MKIYKYLFVLVFLVFSGQAFAQTAEDCAKNNNDTDRLACYDSIFKVEKEDIKSVEKEDIKPNGKWYVREDISKIDDSKEVFLNLSSDNEITNRYGNNDYGKIFIRCSENKTSIYFTVANDFLAEIQGYGIITYRLDKDPANKINTQVSTDNEALGLWSGGKAIPFIKKMIGKSKMLIQITPFNESPKTMEFDIAGLDEAIEPLRKACNW